MKSLCILFAGPIGSGKSPISNYLSYNLNIPVFNNDTIRTEVQEDLLRIDQDEYKRRRSERINSLIKSQISFIYDASIDRSWSKYKEIILENGYTPFIISLDISKNKLIEIYKAKGYTAFRELDRTYADHENFVKDFESDISLSLKDSDFQDRLMITFEAIKEFRSKS